MIHYTKKTLSNGLRVLFHCNTNSQMAVVNVLYDVGAKDENPSQTGFAHLFEHLMFGGSKHIKHYDTPLQEVGGENNAYTTNDFTNYYIQLPKQNIETALWLESDRMLSLAFNQRSLDVQKKVVCEEFKEHYINKPYGNVWKLLREMCYTTHPYQWMTIGKELSHIEDAQLQDVKNFFHKHHTPANAILVVSGNFEEAFIFNLIEKWFGSIPNRTAYKRNLPTEPLQTSARTIEHKAKVASNAFYKCWHIKDRLHDDYYTTDVLSDILGQGHSARLHQTLIKDKKLLSHCNAYHLGSIDNGLFVVEGKLNPDVSFAQVETILQDTLDDLQQNKIEEKELEKIKNQIETSIAFENLSMLNVANELAYFELLGNANLINEEFSHYAKIQIADIQTVSQNIFQEHNSNTLYYIAE